MLKIIFLFSLFMMNVHAKTAFEDFGGLAGLKNVVDDTMTLLLSNEKTAPFFVKADQVRIKAMLVEQFCFELGGPCVYSGQNMKRAHKGQDIDTSHFNSLVESLQKAMDKNKVPFRSQNILLAKLAPMHKDIISK